MTAGAIDRALAPDTDTRSDPLDEVRPALNYRCLQTPDDKETQ